MAESVKARLSSRVVIPETNRRERREKNRSPRRFKSPNNRRNGRDYQQHDDRTHSPDRRSNIIRENENNPRRSRQDNHLAIKERLGLVRGQDRPPRAVEINLDPRDVPRGKRYFEHDDRESSSGQQNFNDINRRRSFPRQRSRSPVWKRDHFDNDDRRNRLERPRQRWRQSERNARSPVWKHDRFEEQETQDEEVSKEDNKDENHQPRSRGKVF